MNMSGNSQIIMLKARVVRVEINAIYCTSKQVFCVEKYCLIIMPPKHRTALSKFRCGIARRIETGRYENLKENERVCPFCDCIEDEVHVLLYCNLYADC